MFYKVNYQKYLIHYPLIHEMQLNQVDHQQIPNQVKLQLMKYISQNYLFIKMTSFFLAMTFLLS